MEEVVEVEAPNEAVAQEVNVEPVVEEALAAPPVTPKSVEEQPPAKPPPKPKGHRRKDPNTEVLTDKTSCEDCNQVISKHTKRYTHKCPAKKTEVVVESIQAPEPEPVIEQPPRTRKAPAQPSRRLLGLDTIDHNHLDVHYVVAKYMSSMRDNYLQEKADRYKNLVRGRL